MNKNNFSTVKLEEEPLTVLYLDPVDGSLTLPRTVYERLKQQGDPWEIIRKQMMDALEI